MKKSGEEKVENVMEELCEHVEEFYEYVSEKLLVVDKVMKDHQYQQIESISPGLLVVLKNIELKLDTLSNKIIKYLEVKLDRYYDSLDNKSQDLLNNNLPEKDYDKEI